MEDVLEVADSLEVGDGVAPGDVAAGEEGVVRGGDGHVAHPVGVGAPDAGHGGVLEEVGEVDVGGGVEVAAEAVAAVGHVQAGEEFGMWVLAGAAVLGVRVVVEGVVASLGELAVPDYFSLEMGV